MTYYHASTVGYNLKRLVVLPTLVDIHIVVYATRERAVEAFGGDREVYELEYDENYVADGKCFGRPGEYWLFSSVDVRRVLPVTYK